MLILSPLLGDVKTKWGMNNLQLAQQLGIHNVTVGNWLNGKAGPRQLATFTKIRQECKNLLNGKTVPSAFILTQPIAANETVVHDILIGEMEQVEFELTPPPGEMPEEWWDSFDEEFTPIQERPSSPLAGMAVTYSLIAVAVGFFGYWIGMH
jgi:hypothetical protein